MNKRSYLRAIDILNLSYLAIISIIILVFHKNMPNWLPHFFMHIAIFAAYWGFCRLTAFSRRRGIRFLRDAISPILLIFYYEETGNLNHLIFPFYFDSFVAGIEEKIFGGQPALIFYHAMPSRLFSELMHFSYFSYYLLIPWLGLFFWLRRRQKEYDSLMFSGMLNMFFCYLFFIVFPCAGPWFYFAANSARWDFPGYLFVPIMEYILKHGEIANGAFPSSHVALATVILCYAAKYTRANFWVMIFIVLSLYASTVYTQAHYLIDVPAGLAVGIFFFLVGDKVKNWLERRLPIRVSDDEYINAVSLSTSGKKYGKLLNLETE